MKSMSLRFGILSIMVFALGATQLSCNVNDYCLNCATGDGGTGSGSSDALDAANIDAPPDAGCIPTGTEICDGLDNDCNGLADDGVLPEVDDLCTNQVGACSGGRKSCQAFAGCNASPNCNAQVATNNCCIKCSKNPAAEKCDFIDNNCNGTVDEGDPGGSGTCGTPMGECISGILHCQSAAGCDATPACDATVPGNTCCVKCTGFVDQRLFAETCNAKDDNCNGTIDEGVTLGACTWQGATDTGACNIGTLSCVGGSPQCTGAIYPRFELCNGLDDDCNGGIDEPFDKLRDPRNCGACNNVCARSSKTCVGGTNAKLPCTAACVAGANAGLSCNIDTDCPGSTCATADCPGSTCAVNSQPCCGDSCSPSKPTQASGTCSYECNVGFIDLNGSAADGCEYKCSKTGSEECDGIDNDCNGVVDDGLIAPVGLCLTAGVCAGTVKHCAAGSAVGTVCTSNSTCPGSTCSDATCTGATSWQCLYPSTRQMTETLCDGLDNDCNGNIDENQPNLGQACNDGLGGVCRGTGTFQCNTGSPAGPAICNITMPGQPPGTESCNAKDDDCDGETDETADTAGVLVGQDWIPLGNGKQMMRFEASKPDATATDQGITTTITTGGINSVTRTQVCSKSGVLPWTNVTYPQAQAACAAIGASLCTESQWHHACSVVASPTFPLAVSTAASTVIEAEDYTGIGYANAPAEVACTGAVDDDNDGRVNDGCPAMGPAEIDCTDTVDNDADGLVNDGCPAFGIAARSWVPDYTAGFSGIAAMEATPNTFGGGVTLGNELTQSPRLDYAVTAMAGTYHVQLKMYQTGIAGNNDLAFVGMTPASGARTTVTMPATSPAFIACSNDTPCSVANGYTGGKCVDGDFQNNCVGGTNAGTICTSAANCTGGGTCTGTVDHCSGWRWVDAAATFTVAATSAQTVSVYMGDDGVKIDKIALTLTNAAPADAPLGKGNTWAYGNPPDPNIYSPTTCNGHDFSSANDNVLTTGTLGGGSLTSCFAKLTAGNIFDMSGNVKEWTFAQQPGQNAVRGGASNSTDVGTTCALNFTVADDRFLFPNIGFRCCK